MVAYVTPVMAQGQKRAILHYEHDLASYQAALNDGNEWSRLVRSRRRRERHWIISDSRRPVPLLMQE